MRIPVVVDCSGRRTLRYSFALRRFGLKRDGTQIYKGVVSEHKMEQIRQYCWENHLKFHTDNRYGTRSATYRACFFQNNKPVFGRYYFCAYCGKLLTRRRLTVDHLYPVAKVSQDVQLQRKLKRQGINELNSPKNLVAACYRCNQKKSAQMGSWVIRGKIGRHAWVWYLRWILRLMILVAFLYGISRLYVILDMESVLENCKKVLNIL